MFDEFLSMYVMILIKSTNSNETYVCCIRKATLRTIDQSMQNYLCRLSKDQQITGLKKKNKHFPSK